MTNQPNFVYTHLSDVGSTAIKQVGYNDNTKRLFIRFKNSNNEAVYDNVPRAEYDALVDPRGSVGQYYAYNIKGSYTGTTQSNTRLRKSEGTVKPAKVVQAPAPTVTVPVTAAKTSRYSVAWQAEGGKVGGNPEFQATDENDALSQFSNSLSQAVNSGFFTTKNIVIKSITRYVD